MAKVTPLFGERHRIKNDKPVFGTLPSKPQQQAAKRPVVDRDLKAYLRGLTQPAYYNHGQPILDENGKPVPNAEAQVTAMEKAMAAPDGTITVGAFFTAGYGRRKGFNRFYNDIEGSPPDQVIARVAVDKPPPAPAPVPPPKTPVAPAPPPPQPGPTPPKTQAAPTAPAGTQVAKADEPCRCGRMHYRI